MCRGSVKRSTDGAPLWTLSLNGPLTTAADGLPAMASDGKGGCGKNEEKKKEYERRVVPLRKKQRSAAPPAEFACSRAPASPPLPTHTMLASALASVRTSVLRHAAFAPPAAAAALGGAAAARWRGAAPFSTYLDQGAVTERVLKVVKAFDKVDPAKVRRRREEGRREGCAADRGGGGGVALARSPPFAGGVRR